MELEQFAHMAFVDVTARETKIFENVVRQTPLSAWPGTHDAAVVHVPHTLSDVVVGGAT